MILTALLNYLWFSAHYMPSLVVFLAVASLAPPAHQETAEVLEAYIPQLKATYV